MTKHPNDLSEKKICKYWRQRLVNDDDHSGFSVDV
jgi:hypothetical protein